MLNLFIAADPVNVAAASKNATCTASQPKTTSTSTSDRTCEGVIDEGYYPSSGRWAFTDHPVGTWLKVTFVKAYTISAVDIMPLYEENRFENISLTFDDDTSVHVSPTKW